MLFAAGSPGTDGHGDGKGGALRLRLQPLHTTRTCSTVIVACVVEFSVLCLVFEQRENKSGTVILKENGGPVQWMISGASLAVPIT